MAHKPACACRRCRLTRDQYQNWVYQQFALIQQRLWESDPQWYDRCTDLEQFLPDQLTDDKWENHD